MSAIPRSVDEVRDIISSLRDRVDDIAARLDAQSTWLETHDDRIVELEDENEQLRQRLDALETKADHALTIASRGHASNSPSKKQVAVNITRDTIVKRVVNGTPQADVPITVPQVQERAQPEHDLKYQTVKDAWAQLTTEWSCIRETTKDGNKALSTSKFDVPKALVRQCEVSLEREDLTKRLISDESGDGGQP